MKKFYKNFVIIFFLGISSGLPLALILSTLKVFLLERGFDLKTIGFVSLVSLPYSLKIFFAPIIDSCAVPFLTKKFGQRKSWMMLSQVFLAIFILCLTLVSDNENFMVIVTFAFLIGFASASQDVVIDGYRIELIAKENQALAASFYVYGYRIGMLISGALALILAEFIEWKSVFLIMSLIMLAAVTVTLFADETRKNWQVKSHDFASWFKNSIMAPLLDFAGHKQWFLILIFIVLFKLSDSFAGNLTLPFLIEIGFSKTEIATITKVFGLFATLFGVFIGGVLVKKKGIENALWIALVMQITSNLAFLYLAKAGYDPTALYLVIFFENFSGGIGDSVLVAYLSGLCNVNFSATQYAILVSFASLGRSVISASSGIVAQDLGWIWFFVISAIISIPALLILAVITKNSKNKA